MLFDLEVAPCSRTCSRSGKPLEPGAAYFATLHMESGQPVRRDFAADAWQGPPADSFAWWRSRIPGDGAKPRLAPQDVLLALFAELATQPDEREFRYVLGLLLIRRRILKVAGSRRDAEGEVLTLDCPRREEQFDLRVAAPIAANVTQLELRLAELLYSGE